MGDSKLNTPCTQEARLAVMEAALVGIDANQSKLTALMDSVIRSQEHITTLRANDADKETRLRKVELSQASGKWTERVIWILVTTGIAGLFSFIKLGGGK